MEKVEWRSSDPSVVGLTGEREIFIAKAVGTSTITGQFGSWYAEAEVRGYPGHKLPEGTAIWTVPVPGTGTPKFVPTLPSTLLVSH
jgi:hypothetical protein